MSAELSIQKITSQNPVFPRYLQQIPQPPQALFYKSVCWEELLVLPKVAIVGSRKLTPYGKAVTQQFAAELARAGVVIVSGLAYGVDACAHQSALEAGGRAIAVLPTNLDTIYPRGHTQLANHILKQGGALISEYASGSTPHKGNFVERNRLVSGISDVLLVTEAAAKSGTLHTAQFALDQGKDIFAVPGNIMSVTSEGTNHLIKNGAYPALMASDILLALGIQPATFRPIQRSDPVEQVIVVGIAQGVTDTVQLHHLSKTSVQHFNQAITMLEIEGIIASVSNNQWRLASG